MGSGLAIASSPHILSVVPTASTESSRHATALKGGSSKQEITRRGVLIVMINFFATSHVNRLRNRAAKAAAAPELDRLPEGWSKSGVDPAGVVATFPSLRVKSGYVLRAYQFRSGDNGNAIVWAVRADTQFVEPDACERLPDYFLQPPRPVDALDDFMEAIEGDASPWSYLCASILRRELQEFGAIWHGCDWETHTIVGSDRTRRRGRRSARQLCNAQPNRWNWSEPAPKNWRPCVEMENGRVWVRFFTYTGLGQERVVQHTDEFAAMSYTHRAVEKILAWGPSGYVF